MKLLPETELIQTGPVDHADWNYRPLLAFVMRRRYALIRSLLPRDRVDRLLEVGFGSGVFMPELAEHCKELYGIDIHTEVQRVQEHLEHAGVHAALSKQSAADKMMFEDGFFDVVVAVSALEFIDRIDDAAAELARIIAPQGRLIAVMPRKSRMLDLALRVATGEDAEHDYEGRRERVVPALRKHFDIRRTKSFAPVYTAYELAPKDSTAT